MPNLSSRPEIDVAVLMRCAYPRPVEQAAKIRTLLMAYQDAGGRDAALGARVLSSVANPAEGRFYALVAAFTEALISVKSQGFELVD